jgi:hypothetical protein
VNDRGALRIAAFELAAQCVEIPLFELATHCCELVRVIGRLEETLFQDLQIEARTADDERNTAAGANGRDALQRIGGEASGIVRRVERLRCVEEMVLAPRRARPQAFVRDASGQAAGCPDASASLGGVYSGFTLTVGAHGMI